MARVASNRIIQEDNNVLRLSTRILFQERMRYLIAEFCRPLGWLCDWGLGRIDGVHRGGGGELGLKKQRLLEFC